ncbi:MAG: SH3 domain-containing protein [Anaerolineae bacterium]
MKTRKLLLTLTLLAALSACTQGSDTQSSGVPTDTLAPIPSHTPRYTATPEATLTPLPTFTFTPSETPIPPTPSDTPSPTPTPVIVGIVNSAATAVNVRSGPGETYDIVTTLNPGTGVTVLSQSPDGAWYLIEMENGDQGWISTRLLRVEEPPTPFPTGTPTPNLTALAQGTPLPTAILGGGTVTPTPPRSAVTATPPGLVVPGQALTTTATTATPALPIISIDSINQTATALVTGVVRPTTVPTAANNPSNPVGTATFTPFPVDGSNNSSSGAPGVQRGVDVLAYCDQAGIRPPSNLAVGSSMDVTWNWYATNMEYIQQHLDHVVYEVRVNNTLLQNWRNYDTTPTLEDDGNYWVYWYVPVELTTAGQYTITYRVTWDATITDGIDNYGPGTNNAVQTGSCTVVVR